MLDEIYELPVIISIDSIYNKILPELSAKYRKLKDGDQTAVSLVYTERIDSNAIAIFAGILNILRSKSGNPVYLQLAYNAHLLSFLDAIDFFNILSRLNIIEYDNDYIGGFSGFDYNLQHRIQEYYPVIGYEGESKEKKKEIRDKLTEILKYEIADKYIELVQKNISLSDEEKDILTTTIAEIVINSQVYSNSMCYAYMQSGIKIANNKRKILLTIIDVGKGFKNSLEQKIESGEYSESDKKVFDDCIRYLGINSKENYSFLSIMEALYYSECQRDREMNLYNLKILLAQSCADFRIHFLNVQVIFRYERCKNCKNREILNCVKCLWESKKNAKEEKYSPIKKYPVALAGVHMDVEFIREVRNVRNSKQGAKKGDDFFTFRGN